MKTVFLNAAKLDFDHKLDFSPLSRLTALTCYDASSNEEIVGRVQGQNIIITKELPVGRDVISQFPSSVRLICEAGTGYNNIDIVAAREKNIAVCNIPSYSTEAVAQLAITFILNLSASLPQQQSMLERKNFANFTKYLQVPHFELRGKTLGIVGAGAIGRQTASIALALGMNILAYNPRPKDWTEINARFTTLERLLEQSDFVSLHCPLNDATRHIINKERLELMKASAYIINTSRGALINEADLIAALRNKIIAGAGLDVQDPEPPELDNPLFGMNNVIITPHIGWRRYESRQRLINLMADNIQAFVAGNPVNVVNGNS
ncbi:glycerate dehydrogenase [Dendrosporobacter quercicolus]|uniref:Glycerate dehydrogenase n=2 Tax=Dendrosporobacter quercicolus TaxID=146817 RepID=A0A1G9T7J0_9FIRM|nr:NAD(P)-dependent oxidoreductase [Dendrosporobacter quercicolus]SDM43618.1 glycerate dehydrogenase [Dendrosporobacter quercicolus]